MVERAIQRMTADDFLCWQETQDRRHELIDGVPVAMAGAKRGHDQVVVNMLVGLGRAPGGGDCRTFTSDTAIRVSEFQVRYPDLGVECGRIDRNDREARNPVMVVEVLSASTRAYDLMGKLEEYKSLTSLRDIVIVDTDAASIMHWSRKDGDERWFLERLVTIEQTLVISNLQARLPLSDIYADLDLLAKPRLVED